MRLILTMGLIGIFVLSGCATLQDVANPEVSRLQTRISVLEEELKQKQEENLALKEKLVLLQKGIEEEKIAARMPTASDIQTALKNAGYYQGKIDGQIGQQTKEAIKKFQEANGLTADGVVGSRTWVALAKYLNP